MNDTTCVACAYCGSVLEAHGSFLRCSNKDCVSRGGVVVNDKQAELKHIPENIREKIIVSMSGVAEGYEPLANILAQALHQAQSGKGKRCHATDKPFLKQPIMQGGRECGAGGLAFQARKKILEALRCEDDDRAIEDLLGAINYTAAMVILRRENGK